MATNRNNNKGRRGAQGKGGRGAKSSKGYTDQRAKKKSLARAKGAREKGGGVAGALHEAAAAPALRRGPAAALLVVGRGGGLLAALLQGPHDVAVHHPDVLIVRKDLEVGRVLPERPVHAPAHRLARGAGG